MKLLSILLRIVAILGAAFCVYAWMDTKGKTSESMEHMRDVRGDTLQARTAQVPSILKSKAKTEADLKKTEQSLAKTEADLDKTNAELRDERDRMVQAQEDILDKNSQIRSLNSKISDLEVSVASSEGEISDLKDEIVKIKSETEPLIASLNEQITSLEETAAAKEIENAEAIAALEEEYQAKLEEAKTAAPVVVQQKAASAPKSLVSDVKDSYVPEGEVVAVLKTNKDNNLFVLNKGSSADFSLDQRIKLYNKDDLVAELTVILIENDISVCALYDKNIGVPETIFAGDLYEIKNDVAEQEPSEELAEDSE